MKVCMHTLQGVYVSVCVCLSDTAYVFMSARTMRLRTQYVRLYVHLVYVYIYIYICPMHVCMYVRMYACVLACTAIQCNATRGKAR